MPIPPPLPPRPVLAVPAGDIAIAPPPVELGRPTLVPGWLDITTPLLAAFPPAFAAGAAAEPRSSGPPAPLPLLPRPLPESPLPPPTLGGGGTTFADPTSVPPPRLLPREPFLEPPACDPPSMSAGGGTTCVAIVPLPDLDLDPPPAAEGGGGTGCVRMSPLRVLPQLFRSRLTCEGGGAITAGTGRASFGTDARSRAGADTGGATTSVVCDSGARELARSRGVSRGAGATTFGVSEPRLRIFSGEALGAGATGAEFSDAALRDACEISGTGATTLAVNDD